MGAVNQIVRRLQKHQLKVDFFHTRSSVPASNFQPLGVSRYPCPQHDGPGHHEHGVRGHPPSSYRVLAAGAVSARALLYRDVMSKRSKHSRRSVTDRSVTTDVVTQLEIAIRNPQAALIGALIGGLVPWFGRTLAHQEIPAAWSAGHHALALAMGVVVLGCAYFSAMSVYKFGNAAFGDARKALGFTLALEGVMLVSHGVTSAVALVVLIVINAVANGSVIALARDATCRKRAADARGAATRARSRGAVRGARDTETREPCSVPPTCSEPYEAPPVHKGPAGSPVRGPGLALRGPVQWRRASLDDVTDAVVVSEELLS